MDFSQKNWMALSAQLAFKTVDFPEIFPEARFDLTSQQLDFAFLDESQHRQSRAYNNSDEYDSYGKFFLYAHKGEMHDGLRIYNKLEYAYGTLTTWPTSKPKKKAWIFLGSDHPRQRKRNL